MRRGDLPLASIVHDAALTGRKIESLQRRGTHLVFELDEKRALFDGLARRGTRWARAVTSSAAWTSRARRRRSATGRSSSHVREQSTDRIHRVALDGGVPAGEHEVEQSAGGVDVHDRQVAGEERFDETAHLLRIVLSIGIERYDDLGSCFEGRLVAQPHRGPFAGVPHRVQGQGGVRRERRGEQLRIVEVLAELQRGSAADVSEAVAAANDAIAIPVMGRIAAGTPIVEVGDPNLVEVVAEFLSQDAVRMQPRAKAHTPSSSSVR